MPTPEQLLITKQKAEIERSSSPKGLKDRIDILSLLLYSDLDLKEYRDLINRYEKTEYVKELKRIVLNADYEFTELGIRNPRKINAEDSDPQQD